METNTPARLENLKRQLKEKWSLLSQEDFDEVSQNPIQLKEKLMQKYQLSEEEAAIEAQRYTDGLDTSYALRNGNWESEGATETHEQDHPEAEIIRSHKDNGSYTDPEINRQGGASGDRAVSTNTH